MRYLCVLLVLGAGCSKSPEAPTFDDAGDAGTDDAGDMAVVMTSLTVRSTADSLDTGPCDDDCTLRDAIEAAESVGGVAEITFEIDDATVNVGGIDAWRIEPVERFSVAGDVKILAPEDAAIVVRGGFDLDDGASIDGLLLWGDGDEDGVTLGDNTSIANLVISGFTNAGIRITGADTSVQTTVSGSVGNLIGFGGNRAGVEITESALNATIDTIVVGSNVVGIEAQRNENDGTIATISTAIVGIDTDIAIGGNEDGIVIRTGGVYLNGAVIGQSEGTGIIVNAPRESGDVVIANARIGIVDAVNVGNEADGIRVERGQVIIGDTPAFPCLTPCNVISNNTRGIHVEGDSDVEIRGTFIGTNAAGELISMGNGVGVSIDASVTEDVDIGRQRAVLPPDCAGDCNLISDNSQINIKADGPVRILGSFIGPDGNGAFVSENPTPIGIESTASADIQSNLIGGTSLDAMVLSGDSIVVQQNSIGQRPDAACFDDKPNIGAHGIHITGGGGRDLTIDGNWIGCIGGDTATDSFGISIANNTEETVFNISNNFVGIDSEGDPRPIEGFGISILGGTGSLTSNNIAHAAQATGAMLRISGSALNVSATDNNFGPGSNLPAVLMRGGWGHTFSANNFDMDGDEAFSTQGGGGQTGFTIAPAIMRTNATLLVPIQRLGTTNGNLPSPNITNVALGGGVINIEGSTIRNGEVHVYNGSETSIDEYLGSITAGTGDVFTDAVNTNAVVDQLYFATEATYFMITVPNLQASENFVVSVDGSVLGSINASTRDGLRIALINLFASNRYVPFTVNSDVGVAVANSLTIVGPNTTIPIENRGRVISEFNRL